MGYHVDGVKFAGGSFSLFPEDKLRELIELAHQYEAYVSTVRFYLCVGFSDFSNK
jgi:phosphosulfolactate synthase (CoM biosynthesis protein A)